MFILFRRMQSNLLFYLVGAVSFHGECIRHATVIYSVACAFTVSRASLSILTSMGECAFFYHCFCFISDHRISFVCFRFAHFVLFFLLPSVSSVPYVKPNWVTIP